LTLSRFIDLPTAVNKANYYESNLSQTVQLLMMRANAERIKVLQKNHARF